MKIYLYLSVIFLAIALSSCKKYLDKKPSDTLVTPSSIADCQGLLDNSSINTFQYAAELLCDDYYLLSSDWLLLTTLSNGPLHKDLYVWKRDDSTTVFWNTIYTNIEATNIVLDALPTISYSPAQTADYNNTKGSALFLRAFYFYHLAQVFAKPYNASTAATDLGIVLRLTSNISATSTRASVSQTYQQIIQDMKAAIPLLPLKPIGTPSVKTSPCLPAAYGMLARTYLSMQKYDSAGRYADLCLSLYDSLMDYNSLNPTSNVPISKFNKEVIFQARSNAIATYAGTRAKIDSNLYNSYANEDLRKQVFFKSSPSGGYLFKGDYDGVGIPNNNVTTFYSFVGIVTDEMYLIRAESYARAGNKASALQDLNKLLQNRYKTGHFTQVTAIDANDALIKIINERRKELLRRGTRWADIKRFTNDPQFAVMPKRIINGETSLMPVNYTMLIPQTVIQLSGIQQN